MESEKIDKNNRTSYLGLKKMKFVNRNVVIDSSNLNKALKVKF